MAQSLSEAVSTITRVLPISAAIILTKKVPASVLTCCLEYPEPGGLFWTGTDLGISKETAIFSSSVLILSLKPESEAEADE